MLYFGPNPIDVCYLKAAGLTDSNTVDFYSNLPFKYSYGKVSKEEFKKYYKANYKTTYWGLRKVGWIISAPYRLLGTIVTLAGAMICLPRKDKTESKKLYFFAKRFSQYALGDFLCLFNDQAGLRQISAARTHIKLYELATAPDNQKKSAFNQFFGGSDSLLEALQVHNEEIRRRLSRGLTGAIAELQRRDPNRAPS